MKTIVLCPVYNSERLLPIWFEMIQHLDPKPDEVVFAENNSTDSTLQLISDWEFPHKVIRIWVKDKPIKNPYLVMAHIRQLLITYARNSGCDFAIFMDSDVLAMDEGFVELITRDDADLVGGAYMRMFPQGLGVAAYFKGSKRGRYRIVKALDKKYQYATAVGGGCMCLSRDILGDRRVSFFPLEKGDIAEDFGYCLKASRMGYAVFLNGDLDMRHLDTTNIPKPWTVNSKGKYREWNYEN
jgi:GT2 family glycosyltransferase